MGTSAIDMIDLENLPIEMEESNRIRHLHRLYIFMLKHNGEVTQIDKRHSCEYLIYLDIPYYKHTYQVLVPLAPKTEI